MKRFLKLCRVAVVALALPAAAEDPLALADGLENSGNLDEAFSAYLEIPGMEHAAVRLGRADVNRYLGICAARPGKDREISTWLVTGDLRLANGGSEAALDAYREAAKLLADRKAGDAGREYYPVDPPAESLSRDGGVYYSPRQPLLPFQIGLGSHRDNWLIRRFVALKATGDATAEFARVWELHRFRTRPYVVDPAATPRADVMQFPHGQTDQPQMLVSQAEDGLQPPSPGVGPRLVVPAGFDRYGLQFALDYAYFLRREGQVEKSLDILFETLAAIDLDRNPNPPAWGMPTGKILTPEEAAGYPRRPLSGGRFHGFGNPVGISRKEFIRLAFGAFQETIGSDKLVARLNSAALIASNDARQAARIRRLTARILLLAGDPAAALAAELAYLDTPELGFGAWAKACRRGLIHEELGMAAEAAAEYEKALALPAAPEEMPDADEEIRQGMQMMSAMPLHLLGGGDHRQTVDLTASLIRLYTALGAEDKLLDLSLRQFAESPQRLADTGQLLLVRKRFQAAGRDEEFADWVKRRIAELQAGEATPQTDQALLSLALVTDDLPLAAAKAAATVARENSAAAGDRWADEFRRRGEAALQLYVKALQECAITDPRLKLMLLDWAGGWEDNARTLEMLAELLELEDSSLFAFGKGSRNRTSFRNYFDIAYRVMRGYQRENDTPRLQALGLRIARGEKPFGEWWKMDPRSVGYRDHNDWPEDVNGCLALLIQGADSATLATLSGLWQPLPDFPAKRQLARRLNPDGAAAPGADFGWTGLPGGVRLIAANENILSLAAEGDAIYAGMPWGLAIYRKDGTPVTRLALGRAVQDILPHRGMLWCATPTGLLRVNPANWETRELPTDKDLEKPDPERADFDRGVWKLAADGDSIWIGTRRNIQRYDTRENTLRIFSQEQLGADSHRDWERFIVTEPYVWAEGDGMLIRYDRASQTWSRPPPVGEGRNPRPVGLIGFFNGQLWGHVWLNDQLRDRPCLIDPDTLAVTPVLIDDSLHPGERCINGPFTIYGTWNGAPVFGHGYPRFYYDADSAKLSLLPSDKNGRPVAFDSLVPAGLAGGELRIGFGGEVACDNDITHDLEPVPGMRLRTGRWTLLRLDEHTLLLGARTERSPRYQYPSEDWPETYETRDDEGGLYLLKTDPDTGALATLRISQTATADSILHDHVFEFLPPAAGQPGWLCTGRGIARLTDDLRVAATYTRADGLCANRVVNALRAGPATYFATGWGDHGGGLLTYNPGTRVFTSLIQSDGLATDKLAGLEAKDGRIGLIYDCEYGRGSGYRYRKHPPAEFDPETGTVSGNGEPSYADSDNVAGFANSLIQTQRDRRPAPFLGGFIIAEHTFQNRSVICTTRGVVVMEGAVTAADYESLSPRLELDPTLAMIREAEATTLQGLPENLARYVDSGNGYLAAKAVADVAKALETDPALVPVIGRCLDSPVPRARSTALFVLSRSKHPEVVPFLRRACGDRDPYIANVAAIALLARGERPEDDRRVERLFEQAGRYGNFPYNVDSSVGCQAEIEQVYGAIAPHATLADFAIMLRHPYTRYDHADVFAALGAALRAHPQAADTLLAAYDADSSRQAVQFAARALAAAGEAIIPTLRQALTSEDRIVRSNAARAAGYLGNAALGPDLIAALGLESGLSRASIVWALGELRAAAAVPALTRLYQEAMADEQRQAGSGFRHMQGLAVAQNQFAQIARMDDLAADLDELTRAALDPPVDPRRNEDLLKPRHILDAMAKIGPAQTQEFYRTIAAGADTESRIQAAIHLTAGAPAEYDKNRSILRPLLGDPVRQVQIAAAASLILLGGDSAAAEAILKEALNAANSWEVNPAIDQLARLGGADRLQPFIPRLRELAAGIPGAKLDRHTRERAQNLLRDAGCAEQE